MSLQTRYFVFLGAVLLSACARSAPSLPPSYVATGNLSSAEQAMSCVDVDDHLRENKRQAEKLEAEIASNRHDNQTLGYVAAVVLPPLALATESNNEEKTGLDRLQTERDRLYILKRAKSCTAAVN